MYMYDRRRDNPFELGGDSDFSNFDTMYNTGERSERENNYKNKIKILGGSGTPPPPLDPLMQNTKYLATLQRQLHVMYNE